MMRDEIVRKLYSECIEHTPEGGTIVNYNSPAYKKLEAMVHPDECLDDVLGIIRKKYKPCPHFCGYCSQPWLMDECEDPEFVPSGDSCCHLSNYD